MWSWDNERRGSGAGAVRAEFLQADSHGGRRPGWAGVPGAALLLAAWLLGAAAASALAQPPGFPVAGDRLPAGNVPTIPSLQSEFEAAEQGDAEQDAVAASSWAETLSPLRHGGPLMIPLGICSLLVIGLAIERTISLRRGRVIPRPFVRRFTECVEDGQLSFEEASEICDEFDCPVAEVFHAAVKRWGKPCVEVEQAVMDAGERIADGLRRHLRTFHAISNVAPLFGLLGTVLGMIEAFATMSGGGEGAARPDLLASGISQALVTTASGLCVAIPAYLAYIFSSAKADRYLGEIDNLCQRVIESISAEGLQGSGGRATKKARRAA
jgi:biopolymer transport protein ExbB